MAVSRRAVLKVGVFGGAAALLPLERSVSARGSKAPRAASSRLPAPFAVQFATPPVITPWRADATTDYYKIYMKPFQAEILPGLQTPMWGYNGSYPGPTIRAVQGRKTVVRQVNSLPAQHPTLRYTPWTSVHLHGSPSDPQYDGYASDVTNPGQYNDYCYPNTPTARTLWYHGHGVSHTAENVQMGLVGQYHLYDQQERSLPIPHGEYDLPLIVGDAMFNQDGSLQIDNHDSSGMYGDVILVNGRPWPVLKVSRRKYRFRLLNASVSRSYNFFLDSGDAQFFDHGVDQTVKGGGTVFVPLRADDPLVTLGPDGKPGTGDEVPPSRAFMVLTRAQNQPGSDGVLGTADDIQNASNTDTPWVDQSQTYTSPASHQVFLREYAPNTSTAPFGATNPVAVSTGRLLGGLAANQTYPGSPDGTTGMATWASVKAQAAALLGLKLEDKDVVNVPMLAADPYGKFIAGPARGAAQYVTKGPDGLLNTADDQLVEGDPANPVPVPADVGYFDTPFLTDIAHNADPSPQDTDHNPATPRVAPTPDLDTSPSANFAGQPAGTYDDEMLNAHFCAGDGRANENIALSTIHQVLHSEHDRLVGYLDAKLAADAAASPAGQSVLDSWKAVGASGYTYGERLFQAARFVTEMEYQHLVFEEFGRKVQPGVRPFFGYSPDINAAVDAEFAHAVYRFGHSMLDDTVARTNGDGTDNSTPLLTAFLNPPEYFNGGSAGTLTPEQAAGSVVMGSSDQVGNELDEFVTETLRNNLLGLPLDLATLNLARTREAGVPPLNDLRRQLFAATNDGQLSPYTSWSDFGQHLKHPPVADQLCGGVRQAPEHHQPADGGGQAGSRQGHRRPRADRHHPDPD